MVLYDDLLQEAAREIGGDLCVIPSSVHEVILAPGEGVNVLELQELIRDMNNRVVRPGDLLSNTPYMYDAQARLKSSGALALAMSSAACRKKAVRLLAGNNDFLWQAIGRSP